MLSAAAPCYEMAKKPPKAPETTQAQMTIRLSDEELSVFHAKADEVGLSLSAWARTQLRRAAGLPSV